MTPKDVDFFLPKKKKQKLNKKSTRYLTKRIKDVFVRLETYRKRFPHKKSLWC